MISGNRLVGVAIVVVGSLATQGRVNSARKSHAEIDTSPL